MPPLPGTKPRSRPATREAAVCSTLNAFQPASLPPPAARAWPRQPAPPRRPARAAAAAPTITIGRLASRSDAGEAVLAVEHVLQRLRAGAQVVVRVGEIGPLADQRDRHAALAPALADARIEHGRLEPRIGADQQNGIGLLDALDGGIEQVARAPELGVELGAVLPAFDLVAAEPRQQVLEREHLLGTREVAGEGGDAVGLGLLQLGGHERQRLVPAAGSSRPPLRM